MKIFIHIGAHKTGSTYIQKVLHKNSELLIKNGFFYQTNTPEEFNHNSITLLFSDHEANRDYLLDIFGSYIDRALKAKCHTLIFSAEMFIERMNIDFDFFHSIFFGHQLKIIAYIRRPDEIIRSSHNQIVRDLKWPRDVKERPYAYDPSYFDLFGQWIKNFLPGDLIICPYDIQQFKNNNIVLDFLSVIGLKKTLPLNLNIIDTEANNSLPDTLLEVLRLSNAVLNLSDIDQTKWVNALSALKIQFPELYPNHDRYMTRKQRKECFEALEDKIYLYRPYFREGFDEDYLQWRSLTITEIFKKLKKAVE